MHPFALSRADDLAKAITAHATDGQLAFIAGGTDLLGLMKDRVAIPQRLLDINGLPDLAADRSVARRRLAHRRAGPHERGGGGHGGAPALSSDRREPAVRRVWPTPQHGVNRRQPDAAYALRLFPR